MTAMRGRQCQARNLAHCSGADPLSRFGFGAGGFVSSRALGRSAPFGGPTPSSVVPAVCGSDHRTELERAGAQPLDRSICRTTTVSTGYWLATSMSRDLPVLLRSNSSSLHRLIELVGRICQVAGARSLMADTRLGLARQGVIAAVRQHDTPIIFDWLMDALSYQGVSDSIAYGYMEQHGRVRWHDLAAALGEKPSCPSSAVTGPSRAAATRKARARAATRSTGRAVRCPGMICVTAD